MLPTATIRRGASPSSSIGALGDGIYFDLTFVSRRVMTGILTESLSALKDEDRASWAYWGALL